MAEPKPEDLLAPLLPGGEPVESLLRHAQYFVPGGTPSQDFREVHRPGGRGAEEFYRERWRHDKVVRSTHGVNCTGSCSWKVYVKDGIITGETQQTDYPSTGPDSPEYEPFSAAAGTLAAVLIIAGVVILAGRRLLVPRVRATTSPVDYLALILLLVVIVTGIIPTLFINLLGHGYDYRTTVAPWFRGLFSGSPEVTTIVNAPVVYQVHAACAWLIWAVWPFSRLVHAWSVPLWYLWRPYVVYRSRRPVPPAEPGTSGRRWRKIGVPY